MASTPANLNELIARSVGRCPDNLAVDDKDAFLTYRELDEASTALAGQLIRLGVKAGSPVLLVTNHGSFNVIAIVAILKSGACFVPIDRRTWPPEMIQYVCDTVDSIVIVNTTAEPFEAPQGRRRHVLHITGIPRPLDAFGSPPLPRIQPEHTACIIFTSGSTGRPKGVVISHKSLCLYATTSPLNLDVAPGDRFLHILSVAFDACACMLFSTLAGCGTLVPSRLEDIHAKAPSCTVMAATPSILSHLPKPGSTDSIFAVMRTVILGGETATPELLGSWLDAGVRVLVGYGVTETTSTGSIHTVERDARTREINPTLIGVSTPETPLWLLDPCLCAVEDDLVEGEIVIAGDGVSQGYYLDEERTRDAFIVWNGTRVYRTGDYGRWVRGSRGNRMLEFRGRKDRTIKNRGFLVNLDRDVEDGLHRVGGPLGVKSVLAVAAEGGIVAVVTPSLVDTAELLARAEQSMCAYCVPSRIEAVEEISLSPNGKLQRQRVLEIVAAIDQAEQRHARPTETQDTLERVLLAATEVLACSADRVRADASFVALGGSSLMALKLVAVLGRLRLDVAVRDVFNCRTLADLAQKASPSRPGGSPEVSSASWVARDPTAAAKLATLRSQARSSRGLSDETFDIGPLTSFQLDLAMPTLLDTSKSVNQVKLVYARQHASTMERAWRAVWNSEPAFQTEIGLDIGCGAQIIHRRAFRKPHLEIFDCRADYEMAAAGSSMAVGLGCKLEFFVYSPLCTDATQTASPADGCTKLRDEKEIDEVTIVLTAHHSLIDGVSLRMLLDNVELVAQGRSLPYRSPTSTIKANIGLMAMQKTRHVEASTFFAGYLKDVPRQNRSKEVTVQQQQEQEHPPTTTTLVLESSVSIEEVTSFACQRGVSVACVYYAAWAMAIAALEDSSSTVVVGAVFSNRASQPGSEDALGPYMTTLPLVVRLDDINQPVMTCLGSIMDDLVTLGQYAWARADQVGIGRRMGNLLAMQLPLPDDRSNPPPVRVESVENSEFPLSMLVEANGGLRILYNGAMLDNKTVRRVGDHFKHSLNSLLHEACVGDCMIVNQRHEEALRRAEVVKLGSQGMKTVKRALERSVDRFTTLTALEDGFGVRLTYGELDRLTNMVAHHINAVLVDDAGRAIAIYGDGTANWILGLVGILKTGRVYVPLDPKWPMDRRTAVCEKSGAVAILLPSASQLCEAPTGLKVLAVDSALAGLERNVAIERQSDERLPDAELSADSDLVIVFTSGTTGTPKGIPLSNKGFLALQSHPEATMFAAPGRRIAQFMSPAFDYCNVEIFSALLHGATLVLRDPWDPYAHLSRVDTVTMTPSILAVVDPADFPNLETIYSTGEPVTAGLVARFARRSLFYNAYGPAECSVCTSFTRMIPGDAVTIGTAIDTARMYILDEQGRQTGSEVRGELYLAGVQVLRGYINAPEQTLLRVSADPWHDGERMFRTGDYGMRGKDGRIRYLGRIDRQVKIRGHRVELAGIEQAIMTDQDVTQCAVFTVNGTLAACLALSPVTPLDHGQEERIEKLRSRLGAQLLPTWVPQVIFAVPQFPQTVNGKVDTKALQAIYANIIVGTRKQLPVTSTNANVSPIALKLAAEWHRVLELDADRELEDSDDFFSLGGHSILVILLGNRLSSTFGITVTSRELLPTPSFRGQVDLVQRLMDAKENKVRETAQLSIMELVPDKLGEDDYCDAGEDVGDVLLNDDEFTELEKQVWHQHQVAKAATAFTMAHVLHLRGSIDVGRLVDALNAALAWDPVLRSNFVDGDDGPRRRLRSAPPRVRLVKRLEVDAEVNHEFDLEQDELMRVHLVQRKNKEQAAELLVVTSHSIADLGTLQNLLELTSAAYAGSSLTMHARPRHLDSVRWMRQPSEEDRMFWRDYLAGHGYRDRALSRSSSPCSSFQGASRVREVQGKVVARLGALMRKLGVTHHQMALAAASLLLQRISGEDDVLLGAPNGNRESCVEREALGQFLDRLPIRVKLSPAHPDAAATTTDVLTQVGDSCRLALANAMPFSSILETLDIPIEELLDGHNPLFQWMVTFHRRGAGLSNWLRLPGCEVSGEPRFARGAKFPLMMEWFELDSERWLLHIEYDTSYLLPSAVDMLEEALDAVLAAMVEECDVSELRTRLSRFVLPLRETEDVAMSDLKGSRLVRMKQSGRSLWGKLCRRMRVKASP